MSNSDSTVPAGFRVIPGYPRYAIDESGTILSACGRGCRVAVPNRPWSDAKRLKHATGTGGYQYVNLRHDGRTRVITVHILVLITFVGPRPNGMMCRHLDGNPANNHISNLVWGTASENQNDSIRHGTDSRGGKNGNAKLKASDVLEIRSRAANGEKLSEIAKDFPINSDSIYPIEVVEEGD